MHQFFLGQLAGADGGGIEPRDAARKFRPVQVANPHHVAGGKFALAPRHARRQEAFALFAQRQLRAVVHEQRAFGMMKKRDPAFPAVHFVRLRDKQRSFRFAGQNFRQHAFLFAGGDDERDAGTHRDFRRLDFGRHAADGGVAIRAARDFFQAGVNLFDERNCFGIRLAEIFDDAVHRR